MKISTRTRYFILAMTSLHFVSTAVGYSILSRAHRQQIIQEAQIRLDGILKNQINDYTQELVNERFFAVKLRTDLLQEQLAAEGVELGLYNSSGDPVTETKGLKDLRLNHGLNNLTITHNIIADSIISSSTLVYSDEIIGFLVLAKPIANATSALGEALYVSLGTQIFFFFVVITLTQQAIRRWILVPLRKILSGLNSVGPYISGKEPHLNVPSSLGSDELNEVAFSVRDIANKLKESIENERDTRIQSERHAAISQMTQMLAHDVRKPFSMLKTGLNFLQNSADDPAKFKSSLRYLTSEIERATRSVDGMLSDVMEIGSTSSTLIQEPTAPESLIESTLGETFRVYPKSKVSVSYSFQHSQMANVHVKKVSRIFSNIVGNAVQAMNYQGHIWFKTVNKGDFVEFCIGNSGTFIPEESIPKLFDAFFTSGKKGGTGLGLAIAQKVVTAHGGKIWCESSKSVECPEGKVEFFFTLPAAVGVPFFTTAHLPKHSEEITDLLINLDVTKNSSSQNPFDSSEAHITNDIIANGNTIGKPLKILLVDDESIYRNALAQWIEDSKDLKRVCSFMHANGSLEALNIIRNNFIDIIITDIDMGTDSLDGFELVKEIKSKPDFRGVIYVHSNRIGPEDHLRAGHIGADGFIPKPMAKGQLLRIILQAIKKVPIPNEASVFTNTDKNNPKNLIAIVEDDQIFREEWPRFLTGYRTKLYDRAEDLILDIDNIKSQLVGVITDYYLEGGMDGVALASKLRTTHPEIFLFLSSNDNSIRNEPKIFDLILDKMADEESPKIMRYLQERVEANVQSDHVPIPKSEPVPEILLVEDDIFMREAWSKMLQRDSKLISVRDFTSLKKQLNKDPTIPHRIKMVITDMNLDDSEGDGIDVAKYMKSLNSSIPIFLSSDGLYKNHDFKGVIDAIIPKEPISLEELIGYV